MEREELNRQQDRDTVFVSAESEEQNDDLDPRSVQIKLKNATVTLYFLKKIREPAMEMVEETLMDNYEERKGLRGQII